MLLKGVAGGRRGARLAARRVKPAQGYPENEQKAPKGLLPNYPIDATQPCGPRWSIVQLADLTAEVTALVLLARFSTATAVALSMLVWVVSASSLATLAALS